MVTVETVTPGSPAALADVRKVLFNCDINCAIGQRYSMCDNYDEYRKTVLSSIIISSIMFLLWTFLTIYFTVRKLVDFVFIFAE